MTPRKMALDLQIPRHNLAHFCCAKFCRFKLRLLVISPSSPDEETPVMRPYAGCCRCRCRCPRTAVSLPPGPCCAVFSPRICWWSEPLPVSTRRAVHRSPAHSLRVGSAVPAHTAYQGPPPMADNRHYGHMTGPPIHSPPAHFGDPHPPQSHSFRERAYRRRPLGPRDLSFVCYAVGDSVRSGIRRQMAGGTMIS